MIQPGTKLAHYEIVSALGKGGMGEVWRARDTKLGREVAIKVLPDEFAQDAERVARLEREARMLAALNHPNIAAIHGIEETCRYTNRETWSSRSSLTGLLFYSLIHHWFADAQGSASIGNSKQNREVRQ